MVVPKCLLALLLVHIIGKLTAESSNFIYADSSAYIGAYAISGATAY